MYRHGCWCCCWKGVLAKKPPVSFCYPSGAINFDTILVMRRGSRTTPERSHLLGWGPVWFWINTLSPVCSWGSWRAWEFSFSTDRANLVRRASSLAAHASRQIGWIAGFVNFGHLFRNENASRRGRPNNTWAGDNLHSGSGVLRSCNMPRINWWLLRVPPGPMHDFKSLFAFFTATSALPLDWGLYAAELLWCTPHLDKKSPVAVAENSGPPSLDKLSGTPNVVNRVRKWAIRPAEPALELPTRDE